MKKSAVLSRQLQNICKLTVSTYRFTLAKMQVLQDLMLNGSITFTLIKGPECRAALRETYGF